MKNLSLQLRLILSFLIVAGTVWIVSAVLAWAESKEQVDEFFDTYQLVLARQLSTADWKNITPQTQHTVNKVIKSLNDDGEEDDEALGLAVFDSSGKMIFHDNENGRQFQYKENVSGFIEQPLGNKQKMWRIVWIKSVDGQHSIAIGQELDYRNEAALELIEETFLPWGCGLILLLVAAIWLVHREFKPLHQIARNLSERASDDLSPLSMENALQEIKPLLRSLNELFAKVNQMLQMERSFIADAAHELRSPLTALNVQLDVVELTADDISTQQKALKNLREGLERSSRLVEQMLALSKLDTQIIYQTEENLNWLDIITSSIKEHEDAAKDKSITMSYDIKSSFSLTAGQPFLWSLLLRNLLDNAIRYSQKDASIKIEMTKDKIKVSNNKTQIDCKHISRLGERFFRPAGQQNNGSGLGLSIVEKIAALHHCQINYHYSKDTFSVIITIQ